MPTSVPKINQLTFLIEDTSRRKGVLPVGTHVRINTEEQLRGACIDPDNHLVLIESMFKFANAVRSIVKITDNAYQWYELNDTNSCLWTPAWFKVIDPGSFKLTGMSQIDTRYQTLMEQQLIRKVRDGRHT